MPVGHDTLSFFLGFFAVPALLVVVNFLIRDSAGWFYTAGTDILFSLMAFNLSSAVLASDVAPYIHDEKMRTAAVGIFVVAGLLDLIAWLLALRKVEVRIHNRCGRGIGCPRCRSFWYSCRGQSLLALRACSF
jgi:hypothetical protein